MRPIVCLAPDGSLEVWEYQVIADEWWVEVAGPWEGLEYVTFGPEFWGRVRLSRL